MTTKRTYLLVILGCLLWVDSVYGTTWKTLSVTCPICATTNKAQVVNSAYIRGYEDDLKPRGVRLTLSSLIRCPNCRFTATKSGYESPSGLDTNKVSAALEKVSKEKLFELIDCAIATETNWQGRPAMIAQLAMEAKWVADETGENDLIVSRINAAITAHEKNLAQPPLAIEDARTSLYLIGELHRELGETVKAIEYFDRALRQPGGLFQFALRPNEAAR